MLLKIFIGMTVLSSGYLLAQLFFDVLLRGFAPLIPSRPWVVNQILDNLKLKKYNKVYAFGSGRSGFLHEFEKLFPKTKIIGVEYSLFHYIVARLQMLLRERLHHSTRIKVSRSNIKVIRRQIRRVDVSDAEIIYSHLYPEHMDGFGRKLKFECKPGTMVISTGFLITGLEPKKIINLDQRKGRLSWVSKSRDFFKSKRKKSIKENKAYFYEI